jgi:hypothetical protein
MVFGLGLAPHKTKLLLAVHVMYPGFKIGVSNSMPLHDRIIRQHMQIFAPDESIKNQRQGSGIQDARGDQQPAARPRPARYQGRSSPGLGARIFSGAAPGAPCARTHAGRSIVT